MTKLRFCLIACILLGFTLCAVAQVQNGQFEGSVLDPSNAGIPNAKVTIVNQATGLAVTVTTSHTGLYVAKELPAGTYKITVEASGFKTFADVGVRLDAGTIAHVDAKMELGQTREVVEVSGEVAAVNTEDSKLSTTIGDTQISNLPLNGRNVYDLMQLAPGAVNVAGVDFENGHNTVVNGVREDFNGFLINGVSNKDLSGGVNNTPIEDTVAEFQQLQLNMSAQYGSSAGTINNLVTKSGGNSFHGSAWEYFRNSGLDANEYFLNANGVAKPALHFNQFGGTIGGPIIKDKLFFFGSFQGDRFKTVGTPETLVVESPQWEQAVIAGQPNSTAALLYKNFPPAIAGNSFVNLDGYLGFTGAIDGTDTAFASRMCDASYPSGFGYIGTRLQSILGVTSYDLTAMQNMECGNIPDGPFVGSVGARGIPGAGFTPGPGDLLPFENNSVAVFGTQTQTLGNLFNGNEAMAKIDYAPNAGNRMFVEFNWDHNTDEFGPCYSYCTRGFTNPAGYHYPNGQFSWDHTFSSAILNEFRLGYTQNNLAITTALPGVPAISILDGTASFGSYNGYPQFFKDHEYSYGDMVSISHGAHNFKVGGEVRRNLENSQFNVARPSYLFNDPFFFAADAPGAEIAGVDPGFVSGTDTSQLETNIRHWRNWEIGAYFQDDWKATKRLTLNLGVRWDLYTRHTEEDNLATTFLPGPGTGAIQFLENANAPLGSAGCDLTGAAASTDVLAGVCGPGGFAKTDRLGPNRYKDFGPRLGFAYDVFGDGKTSLRGGVGLSYEGTLYNPLSNSRWNPPYYSFNLASDPLLPIFAPGTDTVVYGPTTCSGTTCSQTPGVTPTYLGPGTNPGQGTLGNQATGNITGWAGFNPDTAYLTGIVLPSGVKDPYVYNYFLSIQREIAPKTVFELDYVGTTGHSLFRAENINRAPGGLLPAGSCITDNLGRQNCGLVSALDPSGFPNPNYGSLRTWENAVNSDYSGLQASLKKQMSRNFLVNVNYTWSHSLDNGSTWHSGATTANGAAGGEGFTTDQTDPHLDWGNSIYDIRHRLTLNYVIQLPGQHLTGVLGAVAGGWSYNGIWAFQSGAHWEPFASDAQPANLVEINPVAPATTVGACTAADVNSGNCQNIGGDFNLDGGDNDRPNTSTPNLSASRSTWEHGWCPGGFGFYQPNSPGQSSCANPSQANLPVLSAPCLGCVGNLHRNQFTGPGQWYSDMTLAKTFKLTEGLNMKFEWQAFNAFNRANFLLAVNGGGAHNALSDGAFGQAAGTLNARNMQLGLKFTF